MVPRDVFFRGQSEPLRQSERPWPLAKKPWYVMQVLAWWLRERTTSGRRWVSERLGIGEESGVSKAIRLVKQMRKVELNRLRRRLLQAMKDGGEKENPARE